MLGSIITLHVLILVSESKPVGNPTDININQAVESNEVKQLIRKEPLLANIIDQKKYRNSLIGVKRTKRSSEGSAGVIEYDVALCDSAVSPNSVTFNQDVQSIIANMSKPANLVVIVLPCDDEGDDFSGWGG